MPWLHTFFSLLLPPQLMRGSFSFLMIWRFAVPPKVFKLWFVQPKLSLKTIMSNFEASLGLWMQICANHSEHSLDKRASCSVPHKRVEPTHVEGQAGREEHKAHSQLTDAS